MRLVYVDEAGNARDEPWMVVAGVVVDADKKLHAVERHLDALVARHIPARHRDGFVFHAKELFNGGGKVFVRHKDDFVGPREWSLERRFQVADDLALIPKRFDLPLAFGMLERAQFPKHFTFLPESRKEKRPSPLTSVHFPYAR